MRHKFAAVLWLGICGLQDKPQSPGDEYRALVAEYEEVRRPREFVDRFFQLAEKYPNDAAGFDALVWVVRNLPYRPDATRATEWLRRDYLSSDRLAGASASIARTLSPAAERLLQAAAERSPHKAVRGHANFQLAALLEQQMKLAGELKRQPELKQRSQQYYGAELTDHFARLDVVKASQERELLLERLLQSYSDVAIQDETMGKFAERALFAIRRLAVGKPAPQIEGEDIDGRRFKLSEYRGKVVMLSFWGHW